MRHERECVDQHPKRIESQTKLVKLLKNSHSTLSEHRHKLHRLSSAVLRCGNPIEVVKAQVE
jgi:hypothetical protein